MRLKRENEPPLFWTISRVFKKHKPCLSAVSMQLKKWKKPKKFQRIMIKAGFDPREAHKTWVNMKTWRSAHRKVVCIVLSPEWFRGIGLVFLDDFRPASLKES